MSGGQVCKSGMQLVNNGSKPFCSDTEAVTDEDYCEFEKRVVMNSPEIVWTSDCGS